MHEMTDTEPEEASPPHAHPGGASQSTSISYHVRAARGASPLTVSVPVSPLDGSRIRRQESLEKLKQAWEADSAAPPPLARNRALFRDDGSERARGARSDSGDGGSVAAVAAAVAAACAVAVAPTALVAAADAAAYAVSHSPFLCGFVSARNGGASCSLVSFTSALNT